MSRRTPRRAPSGIVGTDWRPRRDEPRRRHGDCRGAHATAALRLLWWSFALSLSVLSWAAAARAVAGLLH